LMAQLSRPKCEIRPFFIFRESLIKNNNIFYLLAFRIGKAFYTLKTIKT